MNNTNVDAKKSKTNVKKNDKLIKSKHALSNVYSANWNDSAFEKYAKNSQNQLREDDCYNQRKDVDNGKRLKYMTTNFIDLANAHTDYNFFGMTVVDNQFVPAPQVIDKYSSLVNGNDGGVITNCKGRNEFGMLPVNIPYKGQAEHGDVYIEDNIRNYIQVKKNSCLPRDNQFHDRSFSIFNCEIEKPEATKSVEQPEQGFCLGRNGLPSRFVRRYNNFDKSSNIYGKTEFRYFN